MDDHLCVFMYHLFHYDLWKSHRRLSFLWQQSPVYHLKIIVIVIVIVVIIIIIIVVVVIIIVFFYFNYTIVVIININFNIVIIVIIDRYILRPSSSSTPPSTPPSNWFSSLGTYLLCLAACPPAAGSPYIFYSFFFPCRAAKMRCVWQWLYICQQVFSTWRDYYSEQKMPYLIVGYNVGISVSWSSSCMIKVVRCKEYDCEYEIMIPPTPARIFLYENLPVPYWNALHSFVSDCWACESSHHVAFEQPSCDAFGWHPRVFS